MIGYRKFVIFGVATAILMMGYIDQSTWMKVTIVIIAGNIIEHAPDVWKVILGKEEKKDANT